MVAQVPCYNITSRLLERTVIGRENQWVAEIVDFFEARCVLNQESGKLVLGSLSHLAIVEYCRRKVTQFILEGFCCKVFVDHESWPFVGQIQWRMPEFLSFHRRLFLFVASTASVWHTSYDSIWAFHRPQQRPYCSRSCSILQLLCGYSISTSQGPNSY